MPISLDKVIPWGRSLDEYRLMFRLETQEFAGRILGCGDGPASFNAEATARGANVISCDPLYVYSGEQIKQRVEATRDDMVKQLQHHQADYNWHRFATPAELGNHRVAVMERFVRDLCAPHRQARYHAAALPCLPFRDNSFSLALSSYFLFTFSQMHDREFHRLALQELLRLAPQVRIFPITTYDGTRSPYVDELCADLGSNGYHIEFVRTAYEFLKGAHTMLRITR